MKGYHAAAKRDIGLGRREFLRLLALGATASSLAPLLGACRSSATPTVAVVTATATVAARPSPAATPIGAVPAEDWFLLLNEFTGDSAMPARANVGRGLANGAIFRAPLTAAMTDIANRDGLGLGLSLPLTNRPLPDYGYDPSPQVIPQSLPTMQALTAAHGRKIWWEGMPEFDQSGGTWAAGRPTPTASTSRQDAYASWITFYLDTLGLGPYLRQTPAERGFNLLATCVYAFATHYAFAMGADAVLLQRVNDELGSLSPGIAFARGAARQYDKPWGIDISTWRAWTESPTEYDSAMRLTGGWSASYFMRHLYLAYMSGARLLQIEPTDFEQAGHLNPLGETIRAFGDFALRRHPERGEPEVPFALMLDRYHGFEPKWGQYNQADRVWYGHLPYSEGDHLCNALLQLIYPEHERSGTLVPGGPQSVEAYRAALAAGEDPRPWEPMGTSRWGDVFDVLLDDAPAAALQRYAALILATDVPVAQPLRDRLAQFVMRGGTLVLNARQIGAPDEALCGVRWTGQQDQAADAVWLADGTTMREAPFQFTRVALAGAVPLAQTSAGDPLVTRLAVGQGEVYLTTPDYLQDIAHGGILAVGRRFLDMLVDRRAVVRVDGPPVEFRVNRGPRHIAVTLSNNTGADWDGTVRFRRPANNFRVWEWVYDEAVPSSAAAGEIVATVRIPPYDLRIVALEYS